MAIRHRQVRDDEIEGWKKAFRASIAEMAPHERFWSGILREYQGKPGWMDQTEQFSPDQTVPTDRPWINYLLSQSQTIIASMMPRSPMFSFAPTQREQLGQQRVMGAAGNYFWRRNGSTRVARECLLDALLCGHGIAKVGWDSKDSVAAFKSPDYETGQDGDPGELATLPSPVRAQIERALREEDVGFTSDNALPYLRRVPPWDLLRPAGFANLRDCPWVMERYTVLLEDVRRSPLFRLPPGIEADAHIQSMPMAQEQATDSIRQHLSEPDAVTIYELHHWVDRSGTRSRYTTYFWAPNSAPDGMVMIGSVEDGLTMPGWSYDVLRFVDVPGDFFSTSVSDLASIREIGTRLNDEIAYILRQHRTNSRRKGLMAAGLADEEKLRDFMESDEESAVLPVNADNVRDAFFVLPEMKPPGDTDLVLTVLRQAMMEIGSIDGAQRGAVNASTTATAARIADSGTKARMSVRQETFAEWLQSVMDKQMAIFRQMSTSVQQVRIAGPQGPEFLDFNPQEISGRFDVEVVVSSMIPRDPAGQQEQLISLVAAINLVVQNFVPAVQVGILPPEMIKNTIERIFDIYGENPEAFMGPIGDVAGQLMDGVRRPSPVSASGGQAGPDTPQPQPGPPGVGGI
jgi:hypothetical protein